jgi:hypothetical protein
MWVTFAAGFAAVYQALLAILIGLVIYPFLEAGRERPGQARAPVDLVAGAAGPGAVALRAAAGPRDGNMRSLRDDSPRQPGTSDAKNPGTRS